MHSPISAGQKARRALIPAPRKTLALAVRKPRAEPAPVDFIKNKADLKCLLLASMGFSTHFIMQETGLTFGQVTYRIQRGGADRKLYRNGESPLARQMLDRNKSFITFNLRNQLKQKLSEQSRLPAS